jgi:tetratricopeptide (TPR) repeat protein
MLTAGGGGGGGLRVDARLRGPEHRVAEIDRVGKLDSLRKANGETESIMASHAHAELKGSARLGDYLRRLRTGYGYSLRRVEQRARAEGGEIDNSQLSRYEKGICYPSFDKLRVLASVFNVSVQAFSDVVDLESYDHLKPASGDPPTLIELGHAALRSGEVGRAYALYQRAVELLEDAGSDGSDIRTVTKARISLALALRRIGKLALAEQTLRHALRDPGRVEEDLRRVALLNLADLHADQGDFLLAEIESARALEESRSAEDLQSTARALHTLARVLAETDRGTEAVERYAEASQLYARAGDAYEAIRVRINVGGCLVALGKHREGIRCLKAALDEARSGRHRRLEAQAWTNLGEAWFRQGDPRRAQACLRRSDALAGGEERYTDLLFVNAWYEWRMAGREGNPTRERIAFGRLKTLRSSLERRLPEVDEFDAYIERGRSHA